MIDLERCKLTDGQFVELKQYEKVEYIPIENHEPSFSLKDYHLVSAMYNGNDADLDAKCWIIGYAINDNGHAVIAYIEDQKKKERKDVRRSWWQTLLPLFYGLIGSAVTLLIGYIVRVISDG